MAVSRQLDAWTGEFGAEYLDRNSDVSDERVNLAAKALASVLAHCSPPPRSILEVGANIGVNLMALARVTDAALFGIEPFAQAHDRMVALVGKRLAGSAVAQAQSIPHADASMDLVFTSGVLIHVAPQDLPAAMTEVHRVARRYIMCSEYFAKQPESIRYRGEEGLLFKRDFGRLYLELFPALTPVAQGFCWSVTTPYDDTTWWLFEKPAA